MSKPRTPYTPFGGGLDLVTPPTSIDPGRLIFAENWEALVEGGYRAIRGYTKIGGTVPGEGAILGTAVLNTGEPIAIRAIVGSLSATFWKNVLGTWVPVATGLPVGRYDFDTGTFTAVGTGRRLFMQCDDAAAKPWVYDGTTATEIAGAGAGAKFLKVHDNRLWLGFEVGSLQGSVVGDYTDWSGASGAVEIGVSAIITGLAVGSDALIVGCEKAVKILYGSDAATFDLTDFIEDFGIQAYTMAELVRPMMVGQHGPMSLASVQEYGNFSASDWGRFIEPLFTTPEGTVVFQPVVAIAARHANQYRIFAANGVGVRVTVVGDTLYGATLTNFPTTIACAYSGLVEGSEEMMLFGNDDGEVFHMDASNSFNGAPIVSTLTTTFNHLKSPVERKRIRRIFLDVQPEDAMDVTVLPQFDGGSTDIARHRSALRSLAATGALWAGANWGEFVWSGPLTINEPVSIESTAASMALTIQISRTTEAPPTIGGYSTVYHSRRTRRG